MTITGVGGAEAFRPMGPPPKRPDMEKAMAPTADLLGLSTTDLKAQLESGKTLNEIAETQGVSQKDLLKSITEGLQAGKPEGAPELSEAQMTEMAEAIASGQGPRGPGGPGGPGGPPPLQRERPLSLLANDQDGRLLDIFA